MLKDNYNRKIDYLRLSVTDKCNLRCVYCMPKGYNKRSSFTNLLTDKEIVNAVSLFLRIGIKKIRLTGGEPLLRPNLLDLIFKISKLRGIKDLAITTNGTNLKDMVKDLSKSGLKRVNISIDTLNHEKFHQITGFNKLENVLSGIEAALSFGLSPVKINVVLFKDINDDEIENFMNLTRDLPVHVRFIEAMPIGNAGYFTKNNWMPFKDIETRYPLAPIERDKYPKGCGPAKYYKLKNSKGTIGFISALSEKFCSSCNRVRLSSKGVLYQCLSSSEGINIRELFSLGKPSDNTLNILKSAIVVKPEKHDMSIGNKSRSFTKQNMCQIGG